MAPVGLAITWKASGAPAMVRTGPAVPAGLVTGSALPGLPAIGEEHLPAAIRFLPLPRQRGLLPRQHGLGLALEIDIGIAADVDRDPPDRAASECVRVLARVVGGHWLAAVAADAQALAREREHPGLGPDAAFADLLVPVVERQDPGGHVRRGLPVPVEPPL